MIGLHQTINKEENKKEVISKKLVQLKHIAGNIVFITDPEGNKIEIKKTGDRTIIFTKDNLGVSVAIEERKNGTKLYHISEDNSGLPSTHEVRLDKTELVYFYNKKGQLQHFVELKPNGDRISTVLGQNTVLFSIEQRQVGGIVFKAWIKDKEAPREGMVWLHPDGEVSIYGDEKIISDLKEKFSRFLDGVAVKITVMHPPKNPAH